MTEFLCNREARPYRLIALAGGDLLQVWAYASLERLFEDAAEDFIRGRNSPLRIMAPDDTVFLETKPLLDRIREILLVRASEPRRTRK